METMKRTPTRVSPMAREAVMFRDAEYGALRIEETGGGLTVTDYGYVREDAHAVTRVLSTYGAPSKDGNCTRWSMHRDAHPAAVLSTIRREMVSRGYVNDALAERAIMTVSADRDPDLPATGKVLVHEAIERGIQQQLGLVVAALRESGAASVPSVQFFRRPFAPAFNGRRPPFAVARFFVEGSGSTSELRETVLNALDTWRGYLTKVSVTEESGQRAVEVGISLPPAVCEGLLESSIPAFASAELTGARQVVFSLDSALTERELEDLQELGRGCTGVVRLKQEGLTLTAQVPGGFCGNYVADRQMNERLSWLSQALEPWGPTVEDIGGLEEVNLEPESRHAELRELGETINEGLVAQTWEFMKKGSAEKFYRLLLNLARREDASWHPELNNTGLRVRVSGESYGSGQVTPIDQRTFNKLDNLAAAHHGSRGKEIREGINEEEDAGYEVADHGLPPEVNTLLTQFTTVKQHLWDTPPVKTAVKKAKELVSKKHGKDVADEFETKLTIARATACESVNEGAFGLTRMQVQKRVDSFISIGHSISRARLEVEKELGLRKLDVRDDGTVVYFSESINEAIPQPTPFGNSKYEDDFEQGYMAGESAVRSNPRASRVDAERDYRRVGRQHGTWWIDGYTAAIDISQRAYATTPAKIATEMGLAEAAFSQAARDTINKEMHKDGTSKSKAAHSKKVAAAIGVAKAKGQKVPPYKGKKESVDEADTPLAQAQLGRTFIKAAGTFKPAAPAEDDGSAQEKGNEDKPPKDEKPKNAKDGDGDDAKGKGKEAEEPDDDDDDEKDESLGERRDEMGREDPWTYAQKVSMSMRAFAHQSRKDLTKQDPEEIRRLADTAKEMASGLDALSAKIAQTRATSGKRGGWAVF